MKYLDNFLKGAKRFVAKPITYLAIASLPLFYSCDKPEDPEPIQTTKPSGNPSGSNDDNNNNQDNDTNDNQNNDSKTGETDVNGKVYFTDSSTLEEVVINVVDSKNNPLSGVDVNFTDGEGYEIFWLNDPAGNYLPTLGIFPHNSSHTIEMGKAEEGIYEIYKLEDGNPLGEVVWKWRDDKNMGFSTYAYEKTINYDEYLEIQERGGEVIDFLWKGIEYFLKFKLPKKPSEIIEKLFPEEENPPQRWDLYNCWDGQNRYFTLIPSNIPSVNINNLNIEEGEVNISWEGTDKDTYGQFVFLPDNKDLTKYVDGNSTSDLEYSYRITKNGNVVNNWTAYNSKTSSTINIDDAGNYNLELRVKDEVDNVGETSVDFSIEKENLNSGIFTDTRDNQEYKWVKIGEQIWMAENLNYFLQNSKCFSGDSSVDCKTYGQVYSWQDILDGETPSFNVDVKGVCYDGWHIPSDSEWQQLVDYLGGDDQGFKLKQGGESNFEALPGTFYIGNDVLLGQVYACGFVYFWSSTESDKSNVFIRSLDANNSDIKKGEYKKTFYASVRCIKDD